MRSTCLSLRPVGFTIAALAMMLGWMPSIASAQGVFFLQGPNLGTYTIGYVDIYLSASGGDGVHYSWEVIAGQLPPGVSLRSDPSSFRPSTTAAELIGVATTAGTYNFRLRVTSGAVSATQDATIKVTRLALKDQFTLPDAFVGASYTPYRLTALNAAGPVTWTTTFGAPPPGMTFSGGVLSG